MPWFDYQIAAGNNNAAGLTNIESITPSGNIAFPPPAARGYKNPGTRRVRGNGVSTYTGYVSQIWRMVSLTYEQYAYLKTTYCGGGYSGPVTVRTRFGTAAYANYNAVLNIPTEADLAQVDYGWGYQPAVLTYTRMVAL